MLEHWRRAHRIVLKANPDFREVVFDSPPSEPGDEEVIRAIGGKRLPIVGRIEVFVIEEAQPRWLAFLNGEHDFIQWVPNDFINTVAPEGKLAAYLANRGVRMVKEVHARTGYTYFNLDDPMVGGLDPPQVALRRAVTLAYNEADEIRVIRKGQAIRAQSPIPPGVMGYDPPFHSPTLEYNPAKAKALLDMFGFVDRDGDGYRENPDGSPLSFDHASYPTQRERQRNELWKRSMDEIGIRVTFDKVEKLPELRKQARVGKVQSFSYGWIADYPDGENFLQLMWKGSIGQANYAMFDLPEYNALYDKAKRLPDGPERNAVYAQMVKLICVYVPWMVETYKMGTILMHPWLLNYRKHPFGHEPWRYVDIDLAKQPK